MKQLVLTICYQHNPWHSTIGGIQTITSSFIKYAPDAFDIQLAGTRGDPSVQTNVWHQAKWAGIALSFMPLFTFENDDIRRLAYDRQIYSHPIEVSAKTEFSH